MPSTFRNNYIASVGRQNVQTRSTDKTFDILKLFLDVIKYRNTKVSKHSSWEIEFFQHYPTNVSVFGLNYDVLRDALFAHCQISLYSVLRAV